MLYSLYCLYLISNTGMKKTLPQFTKLQITHCSTAGCSLWKLANMTSSRVTSTGFTRLQPILCSVSVKKVVNEQNTVSKDSNWGSNFSKFIHYKVYIRKLDHHMRDIWGHRFMEWHLHNPSTFGPSEHIRMYFTEKK